MGHKSTCLYRGPGPCGCPGIGEPAPPPIGAPLQRIREALEWSIETIKTLTVRAEDAERGLAKAAKRVVELEAQNATLVGRITDLESRLDDIARGALS